MTAPEPRRHGIGGICLGYILAALVATWIAAGIYLTSFLAGLYWVGGEVALIATFRALDGRALCRS